MPMTVVPNEVVVPREESPKVAGVEADDHRFASHDVGNVDGHEIGADEVHARFGLFSAILVVLGIEPKRRADGGVRFTHRFLVGPVKFVNPCQGLLPARLLRRRIDSI